MAVDGAGALDLTDLKLELSSASKSVCSFILSPWLVRA